MQSPGKIEPCSASDPVGCILKLLLGYVVLLMSFLSQWILKDINISTHKREWNFVGILLEGSSETFGTIFFVASS